MSLPKELLEVLACPFCKSSIKYDEENQKLICANSECGLIYSIKEGIPVMLIDEAEKPCPNCKEEREFKDEKIICNKCGKTLEFKRITPK